ISQVNAFLAQETPLDTHLQRMERHPSTHTWIGWRATSPWPRVSHPVVYIHTIYLPVAEGITSSAEALQECLAEHPVDKLVTEECTSLLECLTPLADRFHTQCEVY
ncbi:hypothetical protein KIPB_014242, partial [Kipferlia bialata]